MRIFISALLFFNYSYSQISLINNKKEDVFKQEILREFKNKRKNKNCRNYRKTKNLGIHLIYWVSVNEKKLSGEYYKLFEEISFNSPNLKKIKLDEVEKKEELLFSVIIYKDESLICEYGGGTNNFYGASKYGQNLLNVIKSNKIVSVFQLLNFNADWPYLLINNKNEMFIFIDTVIEGNIGYRLFSCKDYFHKINNNE